MDPVVVVLLVVGFVIALPIVVLVWYFGPSASIRRELRDTPRFSIKDAPDHGPIKIVGKVRKDTELLISPLSGASCVYYRIVVEKYRARHNSGLWKEIIREEKLVASFMVEDATGRAQVDTRRAELAIESDDSRSSGTFDDPSPEEAAFLTRHNKSGQGLIFNRTLRYTEQLIAEGEDIAVLAIPTRTGEAVVMRAQPQCPLLISDDPSTLRSRSRH